MLSLVTAVVMGAAIASSSFVHAEEHHISLQDFKEWAARHGKSYEKKSMEDSAFAQWVKNIGIVEKINNSTSSTWKATVENKFGDISQEEFQKTFLMKQVETKSIVEQIKKKSHSPSSIIRKSGSRRVGEADATTYDWRDFGAVTEVKDQGSVGTCWSFSTIGNIEGQWFLSKDELISLSEEYLVDCDGSYDADLNHADCSVFGGWPYLAYDFVIDTGGVPTEEADPYCAGTGDCYPCMHGPVQYCGPPPYFCDDDRDAMCTETAKYATISSWEYMSNDETELKTKLANVGPLSALLDATNLQFYDSGVWSGQVEDHPFLGCSTEYLNHAILLAGYGTDEATKQDYWLVKNSWGVKWGEEGYFRITRGSGACGINTAVTSSYV